MDKIIFQEGSFLIQPVTKVVEKTETSFGFLLKSLRRFGQHLGVDAARIAQLEAKINKETVELADVFDEILRSWKSCKGSTATLNVLIDAFVELHLNDIADALKIEFCMGFDDVNIMVQGRTYKISKIWEKPSECPTYAQLVDKIMQSSKSGVEILKKNAYPPAKPPYYVLRTLSARQTKLKLDVFSDPGTKEMVFAIKGVSLHELGTIAGKECVAKSGKQLHQVTSRFILLECDEDYDRICKNARQIVHLIHKKESTFIWIKSTGFIDGIRKFFVDETTLVREDELVKSMAASNPPTSMCISDTAGMGKTTLFANLATEIQLSLPTCIVLFIALPELVQKALSTINSEDFAINVIATFACKDLDFITLFEKMLQNNTYKFVLFLDGYDEVRYEKISLVDQFLEQTKRLSNITLFVTTRPHLKHRLENLFHAIAYEIRPFTKFDQIDYLVKYWTNHIYCPAKSGKRLEKFAAKCLQMLQTKVTRNQKAIAGIPLQCYLLAEVFAESAKRSSETDENSEFVLEMNSIFDMFNKLFDFKFQRLKQTLNLQATNQTKKAKKETKLNKHHYVVAHVQASIKLLVPEWEEKFEKYLVISNNIDESIMYSIGFIEKCQNDNAPKFIHRTFAEYFLAQFLIRTMGQYGVSIELIFGTLFGGNGLTLFQLGLLCPKHYILTNPGIAYFLEQHLREHLESNRLDYETIYLLLRSRNIHMETLCALLQASCCSDLENWFELVKGLLELYDKNVWKDTSLWKKYFKFLPHLTMVYWTSDSLKKKVLADFITPDMTKQLFQPEKPEKIPQLEQLPQFKFEFGPFYYSVHMETYGRILNDHFSQKLSSIQSNLEYTYPWIPNCSPLHAAVYISNYSIVKELIEIYKKFLRKLKCLVHLLVHNSVLKNAEVVNDISDILELLADVAKENNLEWLNEKVDFDLTPLLLPRNHFTLTKKLVELGADINAYSRQNGTFLHSFSGDKEAYKAAVKWAVEHQFCCINSKDKDGFTPLHRAMTLYGDQIDDELIEVFLRENADFTTTNAEGMSLVFSALETGNLEFANKFLIRGSKINIKTRSENAAHLVLSNDITGMPIFRDQLSSLKWLFENGFDLINDSTGGLTPLHVAMTLKDININVLEFLKANDADFKAKDTIGNSVLFHAIMNHQRPEVLSKIIEFCGGFDSTDTNVNGDSALHFAVSSANFTALENITQYFEDVNVKNNHGHTPLHVICPLLNKVNDFVTFLVRKGAQFDAEDKVGVYPLAFWIYTGFDIDTLSGLLDIRDLFPCNKKMFAQALTAAIMKPFFLPIQLEMKQTAFTELFIFLIEMGGYLKPKKYEISVWHDLGDEAFKNINIEMSTAFLENLEIRLQENGNSDQGRVDFQSFICRTNIKPEIVFKALLTCKQYDAFEKLCEVLAPKLNSMCSSPNM